MRPVNLIPLDQRRGESAPVRTGPLAYLVVGFLAVVLAAMVAVVMLGNSVDDKKAEVSSLESQAAESQARAQVLSPYVSFQQLRDARVETIGSLARSRFDWERVIREVTRLIPRHVWLQNMTGTVSPETTVENDAGIALRGEVSGPALQLVGCARAQTDIARLISAMNDVDGVTRVTAVNGIKPDTSAADSTESSGGDSAGSSDAGSGTCDPSAPSFQLVAAFDAITVPTAPGTPGSATQSPTTEVTAATGTVAPTSSGGVDPTGSNNAQGPGSDGAESSTPPTLTPGG